jgi:hypothetical protein
MLDMFVLRARVCAFLLLILLSFQQGCRTGPVTPTHKQASDSEKTESPLKENVPTGSQSAKVEQESSKKPEIAIEKPRLPESVVSAPEKELASPKLHYDTVVLARGSDTTSLAGWQYRKNRQSQIVGFEFSNRGGNRILPQRYDAAKNLFFTRDFQFHFDDRARQDIYLFLSDWAPSRDKQFRLSEIMNSIMVFFPRHYLPAIRGSGTRYIITLPTGEQVEFHATTREVLAGVLSETGVDLNPDKRARKFPGIDYVGKGLVVRADSRGTDPRIQNRATITTKAPLTDCDKGAGCSQCQVPSQELWHQNGPVRFKFSTDQEFDRYLLSRCGFGIPQTSPDVVALPSS